MRLLLSHGFAALSKPRCGSTSLRRALDPYLNRDAGDMAIDRAGQQRPFHPHITGPALQSLIARPDLEMIITVRHPVPLLWSYYKFFQPDGRGRYSFHPKWSGQDSPDFEHWVLTGRLGMNPDWIALAPDHVSTKDLSPLGLEAHAMDRDGRPTARIFEVEAPGSLENWLSERLDAPISLPALNGTNDLPPPHLGHEAMERVRAMFRWEAAHYGL